jgi:hypothetical protein
MNVSPRSFSESAASIETIDDLSNEEGGQVVKKTSGVWAIAIKQKLKVNIHNEMKKGKWVKCNLLEELAKREDAVKLEVWSMMKAAYTMSHTFDLGSLSQECLIAHNRIFFDMRIDRALRRGWKLLTETNETVLKKLVQRNKRDHLSFAVSFQQMLQEHAEEFQINNQSLIVLKLLNFKKLAGFYSKDVENLFYRSIGIDRSDIAAFFSTSYIDQKMLDVSKNFVHLTKMYDDFKNTQIMLYPRDLGFIDVGEVCDFSVLLRTLTGGLGEAVNFSGKDLCVGGRPVFDQKQMKALLSLEDEPYRYGEIEPSGIYRYWLITKQMLTAIYDANYLDSCKLEASFQAAVLTLASFCVARGNKEAIYRWMIDLKRHEDIDFISSQKGKNGKTIDLLGYVDASFQVENREKSINIWRDLVSVYVPASALFQTFSVEMRYKIWNLVKDRFDGCIGLPSEAKMFSCKFGGGNSSYDIRHQHEAKKIVSHHSFQWSVAGADNEELFSCMFNVELFFNKTAPLSIHSTKLSFSHLSPLPDFPSENYIRLFNVFKK